MEEEPVKRSDYESGIGNSLDAESVQQAGSEASVQERFARECTLRLDDARKRHPIFIVEGLGHMLNMFS